MAVATLKIGGREYVVVPRKRYEQLTRLEQDAIDSEIARRGRAAYLAGKMKPVPLEKARRRWRV